MRTYIPLSQRDPEEAQKVREQRKRQRRLWRESNLEQAREIDRLTYERHKEKMLARNAAWREKNHDKAISYQHDRKKNNRAIYMVQHVRKAAKEKGVRFDISVGWIQERLDRGVCELSGLPFDYSPDNRKDLPSVDRRIPGGDYVEENCRLILFGLNSILYNHGDEIAARAIARVRELRSGG